MTYSCEGLIDEDVETIEYRPRSFIEELPDDWPIKLDQKDSPTSNTPKRGSFSDLRSAILTKVGTPRGHRRSKTLVKRCEDAGKGLKNKINRTSSLDVLGTTLRRPAQKHHKSMEEELMQGFSKLADKTVVTRAKVVDARKTSDHNKDNKKRTRPNTLSIRPKGKDRSLSCPTYPTIVEEESKRVVKSSSYDNSVSLVAPSSPCPTIKIELCTESNGRAKSAPLRRKHSGWNVTTASTTSLNSNKTDISTGYLSSDSSSVFNSDVSIDGQCSEKDNEEEFTTSKTLPRSSPKPTDYNCNTLDNKKYGILHPKEESDMDVLDSTRGRASSMIELGDKKRTQKTSGKKESPLVYGTTAANTKHEQLKKTTSNIYGLASPTVLKKLFKRKRRSMPGENNTSNTLPHTAPSTPLATANRKCVHIESFL